MTTPTSTEQYLTRGGITVRRTIESVPVRHAVEPILEGLDQRRGALLTSSYEYPGRYTRWDLGFIDPPVVLTARGRRFRAEALNARGRILLPRSADALGLDVVAAIARGRRRRGRGAGAGGRSPRRTGAASPGLLLLRASSTCSSRGRAAPGLYGAFGYDRFSRAGAAQARRRPEQATSSLPAGRVIVVAIGGRFAQRRRTSSRSTAAPRRPTARRRRAAYVGHARRPARGIRAGATPPGARRARVVQARRPLEVVPARPFLRSPRPPSELFRRLREWNPSHMVPSAWRGEYLVGASPEM